MVNTELIKKLNNIHSYNKIKHRFNIESDTKLIKILFEIQKNTLTNIENLHYKSYRHIQNSARCILNILENNLIIDTKNIINEANEVLKIIDTINIDNIDDDILNIIKETERYLLKIIDKCNNTELEEVLKSLLILINTTTNINDIKTILNSNPMLLNIEGIFDSSFTYKILDEYIKSIYSKNNIKIRYYEKLFQYIFELNIKNKESLKEKINNKLDKSIELLKGIKTHNDKVEDLLKAKNIINGKIPRCIYKNDIKLDIDNLDFKTKPTIWDLSDKFIFTIDGDNATYFDDAISLEKLKDGNFILTVYVSDVNKFVLENDIVDKKAFELGETIYSIDYVPMLPSTLSDNICSLNKRGIKYVFAYKILLDSSFNILNIKCNNAIIKVHENYTYDYIDNKIENPENDIEYNFYVDLYNCAINLNESKDTILKYHNEKEKLDPNRKEIPKYQNTYSCNIISNIKVFINHYIAKYFYDNNYPFVYRNNIINSNREVISKINSGCYDKRIINMFDCISKNYFYSYYSHINKGHFGLGLDCYAHASTPIRNYASLFNQRLCQKIMIDKDIEDLEYYNYEKLVVLVSNHLNEQFELNDEYIENSKKVLTKIN